MTFLIDGWFSMKVGLGLTKVGSSSDRQRNLACCIADLFRTASLEVFQLWQRVHYSSLLYPTWLRADWTHNSASMVQTLTHSQANLFRCWLPSSSGPNHLHQQEKHQPEWVESVSPSEPISLTGPPKFTRSETPEHPGPTKQTPVHHLAKIPVS